jgi:Ca2+-transporting ATPase
MAAVRDVGVFSIDAKDLSDLVSSHSEKPEAFAEQGGLAGIAAKINADLDKGLSPGSDIELRKSIFGTNYVEGKKPASFLQLCWDAAGDFTLIMLMACGVISIILGILLKVTATPHVLCSPVDTLQNSILIVFPPL